MKKLSLLKFFSLTATALLTVGAGFCLSGCEEQVDETAEYTVTYLGIEGASNENIATYTAADGVIILNAPSKEWYDFKGWYKSEDAEEQITQIEAKTDKDITLYARWEPSAYQAEYYANGTLVHTQTFTYLQQTWIDPSVPEINGYSGVWEEYTVRPENFVVLAEYSLREYTIEYRNLEGVSHQNPASYTVEDGEVLLREPKREWYDFKGWYKSESGGEPVKAIDAAADKNITLYARWELSTYKAEYYANGTLVHTQNFTYLQQNWIDPTVPALNGYKGSWKEYTVRPENFIVVAEYSLRNYAITYSNLQGAENVNPVSYTVQDEFTLSAPEREHYQFLGWYDGEERVTEILEGTTGAKELQAKWKPKTYTVQYKNAKGANLDKFVVEYTIESEVFSVPDISVEHYLFGGWYDGAGNKVDNLGGGTYGDIVLTAQMTPVTYILSYGGLENGKHENPTEYTVETPALSLAKAERTGYEFLGWFDGDGKEVQTIAKGSHGNLALTARWKVIEYTVRYENLRSEVVDELPRSYTVESEKILLPALEEKGYVFEGWELNGEKIQAIEAGSTGDIVLKALFTPNKYLITLYDTHGVLENNQAEVFFGEPFTLPVLQVTGKVFLGWFGNTGETGKRYTDEKGKSVENYLDTTGRTLYARFEEKDCVVNYDAGEGVTGKSVTVPYGYSFDDSFVPEKENAVFVGWFTQDYATKYTAGSIIKEDITVYAKWVESIAVSDAAGFLAIASDPSKNYHLTSDINLNGEIWSPISKFSGILEGNGFAVKNFVLKFTSVSSSSHAGMFRTNAGTIQNLDFEDFSYNFNATYTENATVGVIVGVNTGKIYHVNVNSGTIKIFYKINNSTTTNIAVNIGGVIGSNSGTVSGCKMLVAVDCSVEDVTSRVSGSWTTLTKNMYVGLFLGANMGTVTNCTSNAKLNYSGHANNSGTRWYFKQYSYLGALIGVNKGEVKECYAIADLHNTSSIYQKYDDTPAWTYLRVGGLIGLNEKTVTGCYTTGYVAGGWSSETFMGGLVGDNNGSISNSYSKAEPIMYSSGAAGGFVGRNRSVIQNCYTLGSISSEKSCNLGGFAGYNTSSGVINKCYATGSVTSVGGNRGYFLGKTEGNIYKCYFMKGATLLVNGSYVNYAVEHNTIEGVVYNTLWSEEFLVENLYWDESGWIILANDNPMLEWEMSVGHTYNLTVVEPTCEDFGYTVYACTHCTQFFVRDIVEPCGHEFTETVTVEVTCEEAGYTARYCTRCERAIATDIVEALGHTIGEHREHKDKTCDEDGYDLYDCAVCKKVGVCEIIIPRGHDIVYVKEAAQTCEKSGYTQGAYCKTCQTVLKERVMIEPHFYEYEIQLSPTCTEKGFATKTCKVCKHVDENEELAATGHKDINHDCLCDTCNAFCEEGRNGEYIDISTLAQLSSIRNNLSGIYRLTADITVTNDWKPIGTKAQPFTGFFEGNGHTITFAGDFTSGNVGLFGYNKGIIHSVKVKDFSVYAKNTDVMGGGLALYNEGYIFDCSIIGSLTLTAIVDYSSSEYTTKIFRSTVVFGGLVGRNLASGLVENCVSNATAVFYASNKATCTAEWTVLGFLKSKHKETEVKTVLSITASVLVGQNQGKIRGGEVGGTIKYGAEKFQKSSKNGLFASSKNHYGNARVESHYYFGVTNGINTGAVENCTISGTLSKDMITENTIWEELDSGWFFAVKVRQFFAYHEELGPLYWQ